MVWSTNTAPGVPLTLTITLVNSNAACAPLAGYAIYIWHCDREGNYSLYDLPGENFLRGVQQTDANGAVTFTTIVPGCYSGRVTHIHFEIYRSLAAAATTGASAVKTSQLTYDRATLTTFYAAAGSTYGNSAANHASSNPATVSVSPSATTTYTVTSLSDANCTAQAGDLTGSAVITVNPRPTAVISGTATICNGGSTTLTINFTGTAPFTYAINGGAPVTTSSNHSPR